MAKRGDQSNYPRNQPRFEPIDFDAIRRDYLLADVVRTVVSLKQAGNDLKACCPFHDEKTPSFTIFDAGRKYHCFGCGESGDVLDFLQLLHGVSLREAANILTGNDARRPAFQKRPRSINTDAGEPGKIAAARAIWEASQPINGTLAATYLTARGITIALPDALRFAVLRYGNRGREYPCMVAAVTDPGGEVVGVQRTYLRPDGTGKADLPAPRLSLGRLTGGVVRLTPPARSLILTEGTEDALSLTQLTGLSAWAALGTSNLGKVVLPISTEDVVIGADGDEAGERAAQAAARAYAEKGCRVRILRPAPPHKDFNAELMEGCQ